MINTPGSILKAERERQKRSLEEIAHRLKISVDYLKAVEEDSYGSIPAEIFVKAYIRFYAEDLGLDSAFILGLYHKKDQGPPAVHYETGEDEAAFSYRPLAIMTALLAVFTVTAVLNKHPIQSEKKIITPAVVQQQEKEITPDERITPEAVVVPEEKIDKPRNTEAVVVPKGKIDKPHHADRAVPEPDKEIAEKQSLRIEAMELTWASISIDGGERTEWQLREGESLEFHGKETFSIKIGNAGGTKLYFNGSYVGALGDSGKIVDIVLPNKVQ